MARFHHSPAHGAPWPGADGSRGEGTGRISRALPKQPGSEKQNPEPLRAVPCGELGRLRKLFVPQNKRPLFGA